MPLLSFNPLLGNRTDLVQMQSSPNRKIEEKYLRVIARELAKGLRAIHKAEIIHRDIKGWSYANPLPEFRCFYDG